MTEKETLLRKIQELEFALVELNLYLDSHPNCEKALRYYQELLADHQKLADSYEEKFGALTAAGNCADEWNWVMTPFPWELCGN